MTNYEGWREKAHNGTTQDCPFIGGRGCTDIAQSSSIPMRFKGIDYHDNSHDTAARGIPMGAP